MIAKLELEPVKFKENLKDFEYISVIDPPCSGSFYVSFGVSLLESLIRLKAYPEITHKTWVSLFENLTENSRKKFRSKFQRGFRKILNEINNADRKKAVEILAKIQTSNENLQAVNYGIRKILRNVIRNEMLAEKVNFTDFLQKLKDISCELNIGIGIGQNSRRLCEYKAAGVCPMFFLYQIKKNYYAIMYHKAAKYIDEKYEVQYIDCSNYPFTTKTEEVMKNNCAKPNIVDLVEILAENLRTQLPRSVKKYINDRTVSASEEYPDLKKISALKNIDKKIAFELKPETLIFSENFAGKKNNEEGAISRRNYTAKNIGSRKTRYQLLDSKDLSFNSYDISKSFSKNYYKTCIYCQKPGLFANFEIIPCKMHYICINCRADSYSKGNYNCPKCRRSYSIKEHRLLKLNDSKNIQNIMKFY